MAQGSAPRKRTRAKVIRKLKSRYRLLLINDSTFEERFSIRLTRLNVLILGIASSIVFGALVVATIVFTPLKKFIPGYSDQTTKLHAYRSTLKADSLEESIRIRDLYLENLRAVLSGELPVDSTTLFAPIEVQPGTQDLAPGPADSSLRSKIARAEAYALAEGGKVQQRELAGIFMFPPIRGMVTTKFDRAQGHFGVDVVTDANAAVKACLEGTVTLASWTSDAGHVLHVQHGNDLLSIYKHNSVLLKKAGERVAAGEAIAIVGNSGELTTGPHLHFELWHRGEPVDPAFYMVFE